VARGNVRGLLLAGLLEGAAHGYELMRRLEQRSGGRWRPSPGSVYPLLQALVGEGLVTGQDEGGRKVYALTEQGRGLADASGLHELATGGGDAPHHDLHDEVKQLHLAARQVGTVGGSDQVDQAVEIVRGARQALYRLLAEQ
jgi:DNA-binding PadR family transcriptional regulator